MKLRGLWRSHDPDIGGSTSALLARGRVKPLRQPLAPTSESVKVSASWWEHADRLGFTARSTAERDRMVNDVIGRKVPDQIMGQYLSPNRPVE
jgi:hypothetical protein